jgi:hypothetical protein
MTWATPQPLTAIQGGINRLRLKGAAAANVLFDLENGFVTAQKTVQVRPGTIRLNVLDETTRGLVAFDGALHTFANKVVDVPDGYVLHVLTHPLQVSNDAVIPISIIHFAAPFMGFLYVVAEFYAVDSYVADYGTVFHYWIQGPNNPWKADTVYMIGDVVSPTDPNGLNFTATRFGTPYPVWTPNTPVANNSKVEPTVPNGYYFVASVEGDNPITGSSEPDWPTTSGGTVTESSDSIDQAANPNAEAAPQTSANQPGSNTQGQYGNPYYNAPSGGGTLNPGNPFLPG